MRLLLLLLIIPVLSFSQNIAFEVSIEWEVNKEPLLFDSEKCIPYLKLKIKNLSDDKIYIKDPFNNNSDYPKVLDVSTHKLHRDLKTLKKVYNSSDSDNREELVLISDYFLVLDEEAKKLFMNNEEYTTSFSSAKLSLLYDLIKLQNYYELNNLGKQSILFKYNSKRIVEDFEEIRKDLLEMEKMERKWVNDYSLIYLNPNDFKEFRFNLLGFKLIGGNYEFRLNIKKLSDHYYFIDENGIKTKEFLPQEIDGYHLFTGSVLSNGVKVTL